MRRHGINLESEALRAFCKKWDVRELAVLGSLLREDFGPDSDIDLLFSLREGRALTLDQWIGMEEELSALLGRPVDLVPRDSVEQSENYIRRAQILKTAESLYAER